MTHRVRAAAATAAAVLCATALGGCGDGGGGSESSPAPSSAAPSSTPSSAPSPTKAGQPRITVKDFTFVPAELTVRPGAKVTVVNEDDTAHTVTANGSKPFDTGPIGPGKTATFTAPDKPGDYPYVCSIHPSMKGSLTVH